MSLLTKASLVLTPNAIKSNKVYSIIPSNGNGDLTFTRDTAATQINSLGNVENVLTTIPRLNYDSVGGCPSLLLEPQRMNRLLNSAVVVTQTIATTGVTCTVSFYGTGTIVFSGTYVGTLVGTGVNNRVTLTFTPTTGSLVLTVTGSVTKGQLETGAYPTSYIPTTTGSVTRNADVCSKSGISDLIGQTEGVMFIESAALFNDLTSRYISISDGTSNNRILLFYNNTSNVITLASVSNGTVVISGISYTISDETQFAKIAVRYSNTLGYSLWVNGVNRVSSALTTLPLLMSRFGFDSSSGGATLYAKVKQIQLYKTYLTDTEMTQLTTL